MTDLDKNLDDCNRAIDSVQQDIDYVQQFITALSTDDDYVLHGEDKEYVLCALRVKRDRLVISKFDLQHSKEAILKFKEQARKNKIKN